MLHQDYVLAPYLSAIQDVRSCRLVSRFRCGCHGFLVDTGNFKPAEQNVIGSSGFVLFVALRQQKMNVIFTCTPCIFYNLGQIYCHFLGTSPYCVFLFDFT